MDEFKFKPNVYDVIKIFKELKFYVFVVTNQPDLLDGYLEQNTLDIMHKMIYKWLHVDEIVYATRRGSSYYKPNNEMVEFLIKKYNIDRTKSYLIGDRWKDIVCGHRSKLYTFYIGKEYSTPEEHKNILPNQIVSNLLHAAYLIEGIELND